MIKAIETAYSGKQMQIYDDAFGYWLSGLTDGEGCFHGRLKRSRIDTPFIDVSFVIKLRADDHQVLEYVQTTLGIGRLHVGKSQGSTKTQVIYQVQRLEDLTQVIIPLFERYPLRSKKSRDFILWKRLVLECKTQGKRGSFLLEEVIKQAQSLTQQLKAVREYRLEEVPAYKNANARHARFEHGESGRR